jgi:hypothetical protein
MAAIAPPSESIWSFHLFVQLNTASGRGPKRLLSRKHISGLEKPKYFNNIKKYLSRSFSNACNRNPKIETIKPTGENPFGRGFM